MIEAVFILLTIITEIEARQAVGRRRRLTLRHGHELEGGFSDGSGGSSSRPRAFRR